MTGAIYAIRRELFEPLPEGAILDDLLVPMRIVMRGYRVVFESRALAFDKIEKDYSIEFKRKVRTLAGNYQAIALCTDLIKPLRNMLFLQFISHKVCRLAVPFLLLTLLASNIVLLHGLFWFALVAQIFLYSLAFTGWTLNKFEIRERVTSAAFTFCLLNYAALIAALKYFKGDNHLWDNTRFKQYNVSDGIL